MARCNPKDPNFAGARIAVYPMHDDFATTIVNAVRDTNPVDLFVSVDDLGTTVQGDPRRVFAYVEELFVRVAASAGHVTAVMQFSSGGEAVADQPSKAIPAVPLPSTDFPVAASWALYPLGLGDYVALLTDVVEQAVARSEVDSNIMSYASRLDGPPGAVFQTLRLAFTEMRKHAPHTVIHVVLSKGSPSVPGARIDVYGQE